MLAWKYCGWIIIVQQLVCHVITCRCHQPSGGIHADLPPARNSNDCYQAMADLVTPFHYSLDEHFVQTTDGYILRLFHMHGRAKSSKQFLPNRKLLTKPLRQPCTPELSGTATQNAAACLTQSTTVHDVADSESVDARRGEVALASKPVVYLQHALADSSADWVLQGPGKSLAFVLVDAGYNVWMGNLRGSRFSRNHTSLDPDTTDAFWKFSFDEHASVDLVALVNTTLELSGAANLAYIGYSQGTMIAFAALSSQPWLVERVTVAVMLAPVAFVTQITSTLMKMSAFMDTDKLFEMLGVREYAPHTKMQSAVMQRLCALEPRACLAMLGALGGRNDANVNDDILPLFFEYFPAGTSVQNMAHWSQAVRQSNKAELAMFDWGQECHDAAGQPGKCNWREYGQPTPPVYNLSSITTPIALFTGGNDALADPADVAALLGVLQPDVVVLHHNEPSYCHWDFGIGSDLAEKVYPLILQLLAEHPPTQSSVFTSSTHGKPA